MGKLAIEQLGERVTLAGFQGVLAQFNDGATVRVFGCVRTSRTNGGQESCRGQRVHGGTTDTAMKTNFSGLCASSRSPGRA
jgi:hypothetical protein